MIFGHVRDNFPYIILTLPGVSGPITVEFILDTGFDGELTVPQRILRELEVTRRSSSPVWLAGGIQRNAPQYEMVFEWNEEERVTEVLELEGHPLLGNLLLKDGQLHIDMTDGGEVLVEF